MGKVSVSPSIYTEWLIISKKQFRLKGNCFFDDVPTTCFTIKQTLLAYLLGGLLYDFDLC